MICCEWIIKRCSLSSVWMFFTIMPNIMGIWLHSRNVDVKIKFHIRLTSYLLDKKWSREWAIYMRMITVFFFFFFSTNQSSIIINSGNVNGKLKLINISSGILLASITISYHCMNVVLNRLHHRMIYIYIYITRTPSTFLCSSIWAINELLKRVWASLMMRSQWILPESNHNSNIRSFWQPLLIAVAFVIDSYPSQIDTH